MKKDFNLKDIGEIAKGIIELVYKKDIKKATIVALSGELGSGKTHITKAIAKEFGIKEKVLSPTFVLMKRYKIKNNEKFDNLIHIDAYRLEKESEIEQIGFKKMEDSSKNLILIEWPEKIYSYLPKNCLKISLEHIDDKTRRIIL